MTGLGKVAKPVLTSLGRTSPDLPAGGILAIVGWPETHFADKKTDAQGRLSQDVLGQAARLLEWMTVPRSWFLLTLTGLPSVV